MTLKGYIEMSEEEKNNLWTIDDHEDIQTGVDLLKPLFNKEAMSEVGAINKILTDGEPVNVDPITEISDPEMSLYGAFGKYFDSKEELEDFCQRCGYSTDKAYRMDYLRSFAGRNDVIRVAYRTGRTILYAVNDDESYSIYNQKRSFYRGDFVWENNYGTIARLYDEFRTRGVSFEYDVYAQMDEIVKQVDEAVKQMVNKPVKNKVDK